FHDAASRRGANSTQRRVISRYQPGTPKRQARVPNRAMSSRLVLGLLGLLPACDSLAGSDYVGLPLFTLHGTFEITANAPDDALGGIALLWQDSVSAGGPGVVTTTVPVALTFPATFHVDVPVPPPPAVRFGFDDADVQLAEAYLYVVADATAARPTPRG